MVRPAWKLHEWRMLRVPIALGAGNIFLPEDNERGIVQRVLILGSGAGSVIISTAATALLTINFTAQQLNLDRDRLSLEGGWGEDLTIGYTNLNSIWVWFNIERRP